MALARLERQRPQSDPNQTSYRKAQMTEKSPEWAFCVWAIISMISSELPSCAQFLPRPDVIKIVLCVLISVVSIPCPRDRRGFAHVFQSSLLPSFVPALVFDRLRRRVVRPRLISSHPIWVCPSSAQHAEEARLPFSLRETLPLRSMASRECRNRRPYGL